MTSTATPLRVMDLLTSLRRQGVEIQLEGDRLRLRSPKGALSEEVRQSLSVRREEIVAFLRRARELTTELKGGSGHALRIRPVSRGPASRFPLSFAQERLWFLERLAPGSPVYHMPLLLRFTGTVLPALLERVLGEVIRRHEVLRTSFGDAEGEPFQVILPALPISIPVVDLASIGSGAEDEARRLSNEEIQRPFDLTRGPLVRALLLGMSADQHFLVFTLHHIVSDGWSLGVLVEEVGTLYAAFQTGAPSPLAEPVVQYVDFAIFQRTWLEAGELERQLEYWRRQLAGAPDVLDLPLDRPRPALPTYRGGSRKVRFPALLVGQVEALAVQTGATPFMILLAAFAALLGRTAHQEDVTVGSPIAGRRQPETESLIGFFVNTLVLRHRLGETASFRQLAERVRQVALEAYNHQDIPFEKLVSELRPGAGGVQSHNPLYQVLLTLQNFPLSSLDLPGLHCEPLDLEIRTAKFDLSLLLHEEEGEWRGNLTYSSDLFDRTTAERLLSHFGRFLEAVVADTARSWREVPLLGDAELHQLRVEWSEEAALPPAAPGGFLRAFEAHAAAHPETPAVRQGNQVWSYGELDSRAERLAASLRARRVGAESRVGLHIPISPLLLVAILGTFKAGGAFVALPPGDPAARLRWLVEDAALTCIVDVDGAQKLPDDLADRVIRLGEDSPAGGAPTRRIDPAGDENLAYVVYTSGSTGRPKGVMVGQGSLVHYLRWVNETLLDDPALQLPAITRLSFDASLKQLLAPLLAGGEVWVPVDDVATASGGLWAEIGQRERVALNCVPSLWSALLDPLEAGLVAVPSGLRRLLLGGEACGPALIGRSLAAFPTLEIWNLYGPSEATANATAARIEPGRPVLLGRPITGARAYVLDRELGPVPSGQLGELVLGGTGLARGYLGQPDLTAERFVPDPFTLAGLGGERLYRTGDLARFLSTGELEFRGRIDHQVKVRGHRIEPAEIESALLDLPEVREAVVRPVATGAGELRLIAWLVTSGHPAEAALRDALRERLPEPMIPAGFVWLEKMPRTPTGKIDQHALPAPDRAAPPLQRLLAPRDETELRLARIWEDLLGVGPVGIDQGFFELGGHSLLAIRLAVRIEKELRVRLPLSRLLALSTIRRLALELKPEGTAGPGSPLLEMQAADNASLPFFCVHPVGGDVFCYLELMRSLGRNQAFFGLQSVPEDAEEVSLGETAARYLEAIRDVRPVGPYALGGWSMGGALAFEMARQLEAQGEEVALLALMDSGFPARGRVDEADLQLRFLRDLVGLASGEKISQEDLPCSALDLGFGELVERLRFEGRIWPDLDPERVRDLFSIFRANVRKLQGYQPRTFGGALLYFRSADSLDGAGGDLTRGWRAWARGIVEVQLVPGDHYSMLREPHVRPLAGHLSALLQSGSRT